MCVWFPGWPIQRRRAAVQQDEGEFSVLGSRFGGSSIRRPLVLYTAARRSQLVVTACSFCAAKRGIVPGMLLAEAQALGVGEPPVQFAQHDPQADRKALRALAEECLRFSPWVALEEADEPASIFLDVSGFTLGYGNEAELACAVACYFHWRGYQARIAVADTIGAAWAMAQEPGNEERRMKNEEPESHPHPVRDQDFTAGIQNPVLDTEYSVPGSSIPHSALRIPHCTVAIIPPARQNVALADLDVAALRLPELAVRLLYQFDIRRIGQLLSLPRESLPSRFGPEVALRIDQALGNAVELLTPIQIIEPVEASWSFDPPVADSRLIENVLEPLLEQILKQLQALQLGIQRLLCSLQATAGEPISVSVGLLQPSASAKHLLELLHLHLERVRAEAEITHVRLRADGIERLEFHQEHLFPDPDAERRRYLATLIERLSSRLGEKRVLQPRLYPDAQPEFAFRCTPWVQDTVNAIKKSQAESGQPLPKRPACIQPRPAAIKVMAIVPDGPPLRFEWQHNEHVVNRYWGPERIETGWWRGRDIHRDYYFVETTEGKRFWLFRNRDDEMWFFHGD